MPTSEALNDAAVSGSTIVVGRPPKPKLELLLGFFILTAAILLVVVELSDYNATEAQVKGAEH